ncbi:hypothetical protein [Natrarchaeobius chitinivorans]|uniref:hypothetical protein n=1 Tax=Natrarchaeobius chitinivorans TaxID=1679083 RepID=UPI00140528F4|nr:hypothetical protein [Natrarchaeobius chitinivorans]
MPNLTEKQECILEAARRWPNASKEEIADHCDTSIAYVTETLNNFGDPKDAGGGIFW